jgi:hypothetical protein
VDQMSWGHVCYGRVRGQACLALFFHTALGLRVRNQPRRHVDTGYGPGASASLPWLSPTPPPPTPTPACALSPAGQGLTAQGVRIPSFSHLAQVGLREVELHVQDYRTRSVNRRVLQLIRLWDLEG